MAVPCIGECKYFRLAPGQRFEDDFEDGDLEGWTVAYADPQATNNLSLVLTNGQLLIHGLWPGSGLDRHVLFHRNVEYIVRDGEIVIVDEFTGRTMPGRRWSDRTRSR